MGNDSMISVIVCTYNRRSSLKATLASLAQMTLPADFRWELIVVDNNSKDDTAAVVKEFAATSGLKVRYVFEGRQGLSYARNMGIQEASGDIMAFTDDDITFNSLWLHQLSQVFEEPDCLAAGGRILPVWSSAKPRWFYEERPLSLRGVIGHFDLGDEICETTTAPFGANMAFRKEAFSRYGLFRTDLGRKGKALINGEETELCQRLIQAKEKITYTPRAIVYHPVLKEHTQKKYVQSWFFHDGLAQFRAEGIPQGVVCYFGVPRFLFRMISASFVAWMLSVEPKGRFRNKLRTYHTAGMIAESRRHFAAHNFVASGAHES